MPDIYERLQEYMRTPERQSIEAYRDSIGRIPLCARCHEEYLKQSGGACTFMRFFIDVVDPFDCAIAERGIGDRVTPCA